MRVPLGFLFVVMTWLAVTFGCVRLTFRITGWSVSDALFAWWLILAATAILLQEIIPTICRRLDGGLPRGWR